MLTAEQAKRLVDARLTREFDDLLHRALKVGPEYGQLVTITRKLGERGGKRLRPFLTMLLYEAYSGNHGEKVIESAVSQEFLHLAMLVHDDFMDQDLVRYGAKNVAGQYLDLYEPILEASRRRHEADSMAILAGDLLQARAYRLANAVQAPTEAKLQVEDLIADTVERVIGGQVLDTQATFRSSDPNNPLRQIDPLVIAEHKTASYSFETPLLIGAILGGASADEQALLKELGTAVGVGYQLMDDLLGVFGDEVSTGKSADGDLREGKRTTLIAQFDALAKPAQKAAFYSVFGQQNATDKEFVAARQLLEKSGARSAVERQLGRIVRKGSRIVEKLGIDSAYKAALIELVGQGLDRKK